MAGKDHYPTGEEILEWLESAGLEVSTGLQGFLDDAAQAARLEFERRTGVKPFLASTAATRYFDPPTRSRELVLPVPLAALTSITYQPTGSTATVYTLNTDYSVYPRNYAAEEVPITRIRFATNRWTDPLSVGFRGSLAILGQWGYSTLIPSDAWLAMLAMGGFSLLGNQSFALTGGIVSWKEKDRSETYGENPLSTLQTSWESRISRAVSNYRRILI